MSSTPKVFGFIFARGGSKGIPRKNLRPLGGKPLLGHAIETARATGRLARVIVSTDDEEIAGVARDFGAEVPALRPADLAGDTAAEWLAWRHAITQLAEEPFDVFVSVPVTAPLRAPEDVCACLEAYLGGGCDIVFAATEAAANPYFNLITRDPDGGARLFSMPEGKVVRRQEAPEVFQIAPLAYVASPGFILRETGLFAGRAKAVIVPRERAVDLDTPLDLEFAEFLWARRAALSSS